MIGGHVSIQLSLNHTFDNLGCDRNDGYDRLENRMYQGVLPGNGNVASGEKRIDNMVVNRADGAKREDKDSDTDTIRPTRTGTLHGEHYLSQTGQRSPMQTPITGKGVLWQGRVGAASSRRHSRPRARRAVNYLDSSHTQAKILTLKGRCSVV